MNLETLHSVQGESWFMPSLLLPLVIAAISSPVYATASFQLERLSAESLTVAPGESVTYAMRIRNVGDTAGAASVQGSFILQGIFSDYPYTLSAAQDPLCGTVSSTTSAAVSFTTAAIAPGSELDCTWNVQRPSASKRDTWLTWSTGAPPTSTIERTFIGTLTNASISTRTLDFSVDGQGIGHSNIELSIHNGGQLPLDEQSAGSCYAASPEVLVLGDDSAGGCGDESFTPACFTGGGYGFKMPVLQPGQTHRCTFKVRSSSPYTHPLATNFGIDMLQGSAGYEILLLDTNEADNAAVAWLAPAGSQGAAPLPSVRWPALMLLVIACGFLGLRRQRSRTL